MKGDCRYTSTSPHVIKYDTFDFEFDLHASSVTSNYTASGYSVILNESNSFTHYDSRQAIFQLKLWFIERIKAKGIGNMKSRMNALKRDYWFNTVIGFKYNWCPICDKWDEKIGHRQSHYFNEHYDYLLAAFDFNMDLLNKWIVDNKVMCKPLLISV